LPRPRSSSFELLPAGDARLRPRPDDLAEAVAQIGLVPVSADEPGGERVESARSRILAFCEVHVDALHRTCLEGHLTGSAIVVDEEGKRTLLLHHAKLDRWLQPGGHADGDGNLAGVAHREATEETGLPGLRLLTPAVDIDVHAIPARAGEPEHLHLDVRFAAVAPAGAQVARNHESLGARWVGPDHPAVLAAPDLERAVRRALAAVRELR